MLMAGNMRPHRSLGASTPSTAVLSQSLSLYHDPLVAYIDKHFKLFDHLVFLSNGSLQSLYLFIFLLLKFLELFSRLGQFSS